MKATSRKRRATGGRAAERPLELAGRYRLEHLAGSGPVAAVYQARDLHQGRTIAAKWIDPRYTSDPRFALRFREGLRRMIALEHDNLARLFDYGCDGGRYYLISEWVDGGDLARELSRGRALAPQEAVSIVLQVCAALHPAHQRAQVHGGLKPQNILLGRGRRVKVTDCGLAAVVREAGLSKTGVLLSEAAYMAPERARGEGAGPDSDVYALGVILFELLTGRRPIQAAGAWSLLRKQADDPPPQPSALNPRVPLDLSAVTMIALRKDRERRYATAEEMAAALKEVETAAAPPVAIRRALAPRASPFGAVLGVGRRLLGRLRRIPTLPRPARAWPGLAALLPLGACLFLATAMAIAAPSVARAGRAALGGNSDSSTVQMSAAAKPTATATEPPARPIPTPGSAEKGPPARPARPGPPEGRGPGRGANVEFTGRVESIGPGTWRIAGRDVLVTGATEVKGVIEVGDTVKVEARRTEDGALLAREIKRKG